MFDIVVTSAPATSFAGRIAAALREARMRVISCEVSPHRAPPDTVRVDAAVACAASAATMIDIARKVRALMDGPPPVVGISSGAPVSAARELAESLPEDAPTATITYLVQRAAAQAERRRSRTVLEGDLDDVGLESLLASLSSRSKSCFVRIRSGSRRAEVTFDAGRLIHIRADGLDGADRAAVIRAITEWRGGSFEVLANDELAAPRSQREPPRSSSMTQGEASDVALASALVNACAAYARAWIGPVLTAKFLSASWARVRLRHPSLEAFTITADGMVTVTNVEQAKQAIPGAIAEWIVELFDTAAEHHPTRFRRRRIRDVLGGLMRMVEQVGWASTLFEGEEV